MQRKGAWLEACPECAYLGSTLEPGAGTGIEGLEALRRANFELMLDRLQVLGPLDNIRLLEVGSAWGWFLEAAGRRGVRSHGIEPELANAALARKAGLSVEDGYFPIDLQDKGPYDLIVFNDVFEHIPRPSQLVPQIEALLAPGGRLVVNLPSSGGTIYRIAATLAAAGITGPYERLWQKGFPSPHISYFNPENLRNLVERHSGLRREDGFPLPSVVRTGLGNRIRSSHGGLVGAVMVASMWGLSFILPYLPADIEVVVFRKAS
jgi:SAM-dependent methyltransferase